MTPPSSRQAKKAATQARILTVARSHFERDGFKNSNVRAIAKEAQVATGTVLLHFTDKLGLLHASLHDDLERAIDESLRAPNQGPILRRLTAVIQPFFAYYAARPALSRTLLRESLLADSPWKERFGAQVARVHQHITALVDEAKARKELAPTTSTPTFVTALLSFYYFALIGWVQAVLDDPSPRFEQLLEQHIDGCTGQTELES